MPIKCLLVWSVLLCMQAHAQSQQQAASMRSSAITLQMSAIASKDTAEAETYCVYGTAGSTWHQCLDLYDADQMTEEELEIATACYNQILSDLGYFADVAPELYPIWPSAEGYMSSGAYYIQYGDWLVSTGNYAGAYTYFGNASGCFITAMAQYDSITFYKVRTKEKLATMQGYLD